MAKRYLVVFDKELGENDVVKALNRMDMTQIWETGIPGTLYVASERKITEIQKEVEAQIPVRASAIVTEITNRDRNFKPKLATADWTSFDDTVKKRYWKMFE